MCQPKPGPRCAGHTRKAMASAARQMAAARAEMGAHPEGSHEHRVARSAFREAEQAFIDANRAFEATPTGRRELAQKAATARAMGQSTAVAELEYRIEAGERRWNDQKEALAAMRALDAANEAARTPSASAAYRRLEDQHARLKAEASAWFAQPADQREQSRIIALNTRIGQVEAEMARTADDQHLVAMALDVNRTDAADRLRSEARALHPAIHEHIEVSSVGTDGRYLDDGTREVGVHVDLTGDNRRSDPARLAAGMATFATRFNPNPTTRMAGTSDTPAVIADITDSHRTARELHYTPDGSKAAVVDPYDPAHPIATGTLEAVLGQVLSQASNR